eukprot:jgi/Botrbrau1/1317/Bobra.0063s0033.2
MRRATGGSAMECVAMTGAISRVEQQRRRQHHKRRSKRQNVIVATRTTNRKVCGSTTFLVALWLLAVVLGSSGGVLILADSLLKLRHLRLLRSHSAAHTWLDDMVEGAVPEDVPLSIQSLPDTLALVVNGTAWDLEPTNAPPQAVQWQSYELPDLLGPLMSRSTAGSMEEEEAAFPIADGDASARDWAPQLAATLGQPVELALQVWENNTASLVPVGPVSLLSSASLTSAPEPCGREAGLRKGIRGGDAVCRRIAFLAALCMRLQRNPGGGWRISRMLPQNAALFRRMPSTRRPCAGAGVQLTWSPAVPYDPDENTWLPRVSRLPQVRVEVQVAASEASTASGADLVQVCMPEASSHVTHCILAF